MKIKAAFLKIRGKTVQQGNMWRQHNQKMLRKFGEAHVSYYPAFGAGDMKKRVMVLVSIQYACYNHVHYKIK